MYWRNIIDRMVCSRTTKVVYTSMYMCIQHAFRIHVGLEGCGKLAPSYVLHLVYIAGDLQYVYV